jgi:ABC-type polysaccharide/polyol phosphate export permease
LHPVLPETLRNLSLAWYLAWSDTKARYKRSVLGPFWLVLGTFIGVVGLGVVWSSLMNVEAATFIPNLTAGIVMWNLISGCITGAPTAFVRRASVIKNFKTPSFRLSLEVLFQQFINFLHNLAAVLVVAFIFPQDLSFNILLVVPAVFLVLINLWWVIQLIGFLGSRFRDVDPLVQAVMPILFFLSPVLYRSNQLGQAQLIGELNPIGYWIDIVREPLNGMAPTWTAWAVNIVIAIFGWMTAGWMTRRKSSRLAYWV